MFKITNLSIAFVILSIIIFFFVFSSGEVNDYRYYLQNWHYSNLGLSPWSSELEEKKILSSYGPLHTVIGYLALINSLLPKILFASTSLIIFLILVQNRKNRIGKIKTLDLFYIILIYPLFPFTIIINYIYGINDSIIAMLILLACEARKNEKMILTGTLIGIGALIKFYPILFLAFFSISSKKGISIKCILTGVFVFIFGMFLAYLIWGFDIFNPLLFGSERQPKLLSIIKFLEYFSTIYKFWELQNFVNFLITKNSIFILIILFFIFIHMYMAEIKWEYASIIGILFLLITYKVGHPQFFISWIAFLAWIISSSKKGDKNYLFVKNFFPVVIYLGIFQIIYFLSGLLGEGHLRNEWEFLRNIGSIPFLIFIGISLFRNSIFLIKPWKRKKILIW